MVRTTNFKFYETFGCPVALLNTIDHLGNLKMVRLMRCFVGYSLNSSGPDWLFDIDALTRSMFMSQLVCRSKEFSLMMDPKPSSNDGERLMKIQKNSECNDQEERRIINDEDDGVEAHMNNLDTTIQVSPIPTTRIHKEHPLDQVIGDLQSTTQTRKMSKNLRNIGCLDYSTKNKHKRPSKLHSFACFLS
ncbi:hypothetical protein Tco_0091417 [Tanacetum coccineum]